MSNIVHFESPMLVMTNSAFWDLYDRTRGPKEPERYDHQGYYFWWFVPEPTRSTKSYIVSWIPGTGRSTHTWRDFEGLLVTLHNIGCNVRGDLTCRDESDWFKKPFRFNVEKFLTKALRKRSLIL
jgi:hypothetical protein